VLDFSNPSLIANKRTSVLRIRRVHDEFYFILHFTFHIALRFTFPRMPSYETGRLIKSLVDRSIVRRGPCRRGRLNSTTVDELAPPPKAVPDEDDCVTAFKRRDPWTRGPVT